MISAAFQHESQRPHAKAANAAAPFSIPAFEIEAIGIISIANSEAGS
jgi:hypothetical protein